MTYTWSTGAATVLEHTDADWDGVWSLLFAAGKAAFRLSLQIPLGPGAELAWAAMDVCEARDEIGWAHPATPSTAIAVDLGPLGPVVDLPQTYGVIVGLLDAALDRLALLDDAGLDADDQELARRVHSKTRVAREALLEIRR
jgi:hypothetical protein